MYKELEELFEYRLKPISELSDKIIEIENAIAEDSFNLTSLELLHKTHKLLFESLIWGILSHPHGDIFIDDVLDELKERYIDLSPLVVVHLSKFMIENGSDYEATLPLLSKSREYLIHCKHPMASPVDAAFTHASITYLVNKKDASEIEKLYRTALDMISDDGSLNSSKNITDLDLFAFFNFIVKQEYTGSLNLINEFHVDEFHAKGKDRFASFVRNFMKWFGYSDNPEVLESLIMAASIIVEFDNYDVFPELYENGLVIRNEYSLDCIVGDFLELANY